MAAIVGPALQNRYGVPAINVVNDLTMAAVLAAAVERRSPVIVQTSVKTVRTAGAEVLMGMWRGMTRGIEVPVALHLDHCPDREVISTCLRLGWNSVLFDGSALPVEQNRRHTVEVVREASVYGASVEGEIEAITGVEDDHGSDEVGEQLSLRVCLDFIEATGVDVFAPAIGNAHGRYRSEPTLDRQRVVDLVTATGVPMALHGGSGLTAAQFSELIAAGCAKVNLSTVLKERFMQSSLAHLEEARRTDRWDPPDLFRHAADTVTAMAAGFMDAFGSTGRGAGT
ncbi:class II fructose-bisphosphate aldolase [Rhizomonospora bruguierae]|uniref:class II fructose-bisphosphate aldolase n=1 Tax=Rhizomonospora bruguierae TaxID=1581705 RepID=UPI001BCABC43|nr:class II fructose-bisphosphate aldolase [Micromonospora sp. NBRC 107566]